MPARPLVILLAILVACRGERAADHADTGVARLACDWTSSSRLTSDGIGALEIGRPAADVREDCEVLSDSTETRAEGQPVRVLRVRVGPSIVLAEIVADTVWRLTISDSLLRTADGLGVGTTLGTFLTARPAWAAHGETGVFVGLASHCGLSFRLDATTPGLPRPWVVRDTSALRRAPPDTRVDQILVVGASGCGDRTTRG